MTSMLKCNSCNIVVNELLAFVQNKLCVMDEDSLYRICVSSFSTEDITKSKGLLFAATDTSVNKINRRGQNKEQRDMEDIIALLKCTETEKIPVFVARDLHRLPPVTFDSVDVTCLLRDINQLKSDLKIIKLNYVTHDQLDEVKNEIGQTKNHVRRMTTPFSNVNQSISNLNVNCRRGAYLDSGPMGFSHFEIDRSRITDDNPSHLTSGENIALSLSPPHVQHSEVLTSSHSNAVNPEVRSLSTTPDVSKQSTDRSDGVQNATPAPSLSKPERVSETPKTESCDDSKMATSGQNYNLACKVSQDNVNTINILNSQLVESVQSEIERRPTMAEMVKDGVWEQAQSRKRVAKQRKKQNRFVGQRGRADAMQQGKFKAAELTIPLFISNVHKDTLEDDIVEHIRVKTNTTVKLLKINMLDKQKNHNAYKLYVPSDKMRIFLDAKTWPEGIIFRRFVHFKHRNTNRGNSEGENTVT
ncbi:uncharacterized protein LOC134678618 [Cydia fagiglandana]|uniref:uncharacterized protein LOC134678618 n=1 Tax=Cydia fagiglandana TaxID=1458189 RepID=UPI002FEE5218